jgi:hypothetical protein
MVSIPVTLTCGCEIRWADGTDLWEPGQPAHCPRHGDADVDTIDILPGEPWLIHNCPDGATDFASLVQAIVTGEHDIDLDDFTIRLDLPDGWDWGDVRDNIASGNWTADFIDSAIHAGLT